MTDTDELRALAERLEESRASIVANAINEDYFPAPLPGDVLRHIASCVWAHGRLGEAAQAILALLDENDRLREESAPFHYVGHEMKGGPWPVQKGSVTAVVALEEEIDRLRAEVESLRALIVRKDEALRDALPSLMYLASEDDATSEHVRVLDDAESTLALTPEDMRGWVALPAPPYGRAWGLVQVDTGSAGTDIPTVEE